VCASSGTAAAVLVRAGQVIEGADVAGARRARDSTAGTSTARTSTARDSTARDSTAGSSAARTSAARNGTAVERDLARGPARLCQALAIDAALNGADVCDPASPLRARTGERVPRRVIRSGPRTGVRGAAEVPWRFWVAGEPTVSPYRAHVPRARARPGTASTPR